MSAALHRSSQRFSDARHGLLSQRSSVLRGLSARVVLLRRLMVCDRAQWLTASGSIANRLLDSGTASKRRSVGLEADLSAANLLRLSAGLATSDRSRSGRSSSGIGHLSLRFTSRRGVRGQDPHHLGVSVSGRIVSKMCVQVGDKEIQSVNINVKVARTRLQKVRQGEMAVDARGKVSI